MKLYAKFKVVSVSEEQWKRVQNKSIPMSYVICTDGDSYFSFTVWGDEKIHLCKEKLYSETEMECILSITGKVYEQDDGSKRYYNNFTILEIL